MDRRSRFLGLATGIFFLGLTLAFWISKQFNNALFVPILFWALAGAALFGVLGPFRTSRRLLALFLVIFFGGLGILFLPGISFFPGILVLMGISAIVAAIARTHLTTYARVKSEAIGMPIPYSCPPAQNSDMMPCSLYRQKAEDVWQATQERTGFKDEWALCSEPRIQTHGNYLRDSNK